MAWYIQYKTRVSKPSLAISCKMDLLVLIFLIFTFIGWRYKLSLVDRLFDISCTISIFCTTIFCWCQGQEMSFHQKNELLQFWFISVYIEHIIPFRCESWEMTQWRILCRICCSGKACSSTSPAETRGSSGAAGDWTAGWRHAHSRARGTCKAFHLETG